MNPEAKSIFICHPGRIYCFADTPEMCRVLLGAGARVIQLRHKTAGDEEFRRLARAMLAEMDAREVLRRAPLAMLLGVSARTPEEARAAAAAGADYIGAGSVFATPTKADAVVIGLPGLQEVAAAVGLPVVAIGGITRTNLRAVLQTGARYAAIISDINAAPDPAAAFRELAALSGEFPVKHD
ncbi:MAG: thiamine phosphate synthase [Desulfobacterales bacterium]|nr:thiamine phosphate synthase [Desulfobacterales bacterium]